MFVPELWCNQQPVDTFVELENCLSLSSRLETAWNVQPHGFFQGCLNKSTAEIDREGVPIENEWQYQKEPNRAPSNNWSICLEDSLI
jgi:hypothetical protein